MGKFSLDDFGDSEDEADSESDQSKSSSMTESNDTETHPYVSSEDQHLKDDSTNDEDNRIPEKDLKKKEPDKIESNPREWEYNCTQDWPHDDPRKGNGIGLSEDVLKKSGLEEIKLNSCEWERTYLHAWPHEGPRKENNTMMSERALQKREPERTKSKPKSSNSDHKLQTEGAYPENWDILRREAYKRDDYQCRNCGALGGSQGGAELHAHHIVPLSRGGSNVLSNLSTLCSTCHSLIHAHLD